MKHTLILILLIICTKLIPAQSQVDRVKGWSLDIDNLLLNMQKQHYFYQAKPLPSKLLSQASDLKKKINQYSDERMLIELEKLMYFMHDGHSYILPFAAERVNSFFLPLNFYIFSDGVYIIDAKEEYNYLIGSKIISIGGVTSMKLIKDMNSYIHQDNEMTVKWFAPTVMRFRAIYETYGLPADSKEVSVSLILPSGKKEDKSIPFEPVINFQGLPKLMPSKITLSKVSPLYLSNVYDNYWIKTFPDKKTVYLQFNQVRNKQSEPLDLFSEKLDSTLVTLHAKLLIVDVRHNNGGNKDLLEPLIDVIKKFDQRSKESKIIIITGRNTFSAAQVFISILDRDTKALFAGEPSASSPNFIGEDNRIILPWSGAVGSISNRYHENIPGDKRKWINPDYPVSLSSKQYFDNKDPVMNFILNNIAK